MTYEFTVPGVPVAQPRVKATTINGYARVYTPKTADTYKASIALAASLCGVKPTEGPVDLEIEFVFPRPKSKVWKKREMPTEPHTAKPDVDNLAKAVLDSLKDFAWRDDSQVSSLTLKKWIAAGDEEPHTRIRIERLT